MILNRKRADGHSDVPKDVGSKGEVAAAGDDPLTRNGHTEITSSSKDRDKKFIVTPVASNITGSGVPKVTKEVYTRTFEETLSTSPDNHVHSDHSELLAIRTG